MFKMILSSLILMTAWLADTATAQADGMHWGTFSIGAPSHCGGHRWCSATVGPDALRREGLQVSTSGGGSPFGSNSEVMVLVLCTPQGNQSRVAVVASARNGSVAERYRNNVRRRMTQSRCL